MKEKLQLNLFEMQGREDEAQKQDQRTEQLLASLRKDYQATQLMVRLKQDEIDKLKLQHLSDEFTSTFWKFEQFLQNIESEL